MSLNDLFDTYRTELFERFHSLGVDLTRNHEFASTLAYHTSNKPLLGFAKRHRETDPKMQVELNMALLHHVQEGNEKGVQLCLWAGADPHAPAPDLRFPDLFDNQDDDDPYVGSSAIHEACYVGNADILERLCPEPSRDDFDELYQVASSGAVVEILARHALPKDIGAVIRRHSLGFTWTQYPSIEPLRQMFERGARWQTTTPDEVTEIRRHLLKISDSTFVGLMKLLAGDDYVSPEILVELGRTTAMRAKMQQVGFIPAKSGDRPNNDRPRPTRAREVLAKFGVDHSKPKPSIVSLPRIVEVGPRHSDGREIRLDRAALYECVWSTPVDQLAREWGLSGPGLAKVCRRLQIPLPPRGYWQKLQAGHSTRRTRLPKFRPGEAEEIVIRAPA